MKRNVFDEFKRCAAYLRGSMSLELRVGLTVVLLGLLAGQIVLFLCFSGVGALFSCILGLVSAEFVTTILAELTKNKLAASCEISQSLHTVFMPGIMSASILINSVFAFAASGYEKYGFLIAVLFAVYSVADSITWLLYLHNSRSAATAVLGGVIGGSTCFAMDIAAEAAFSVSQSVSVIIAAAALLASVSIIFIGTAVMYKSDSMSRISIYQLAARGRKGRSVI